MPLIGLALSMAPTIASWIFGPTAAKVTAAVTTAAETITGTADPEAQAAALQDPAKATAFRVELAKIEAQAQTEQRAAELASFQAQLGDIANARAQTIALAAGKSAIAWGAPVVSAVVMVTFGMMLTLVLMRALPPGSESLANVMLGALSTMASSVVGYWVGSSSSSHSKDTTIARQSDQLATSIPVAAT
jgi:hypothetical protein